MLLIINNIHLVKTLKQQQTACYQVFTNTTERLRKEIPVKNHNTSHQIL